MKTCERCRVTVAGGFNKCPLCQHPLTDDGQNQPDVFPVIETVSYTHGLFFKILIFCLISVSIVSVMLDLMMPEQNLWSLLVTVGAACVWLSVVTAIRQRSAFHKKLMDMGLLISLFSLLWDYLTGWHRWSIDYVIPVTFICCMLIAAILGWVLKLPSEHFAVYLLILNLCGLIPTLFLLAGWNLHRLPSFICVTVSLLLFTSLMVFQWQMVKNEVRRRLHL